VTGRATPLLGPAATSWRRELRSALARRRRLLAAGLLAGSTAFAISAVSPSPPATAVVLAAARDLAGGATIQAGDLQRVALSPHVVPAGTVSDPARLTGRVLAVPVRAGEAITDVRLVGPSLLAGYGEQLVAAPIRIADAGAARLVRPGDVIDVLAADEAAASTGAAARLVASSVRVVVVPGDGGSLLSGDGLGDGALVVLATTSDTAARLASAAVTSRLSLTIRGE
jgi:Flp pilus assembly protein CpaB